MNRSLVAFWLGLLTFSSSAFAYFDVMDTGEIMAPGRYKLAPEIQFITDGGGANVGANFDVGLTEDMGFRAQIGAGDTDFYLGAFYKYMPFPDTDSQPAIGFNLGVVYAYDAGGADFTLRWEPLISKKFSFNWGGLTPYGSIPLGINYRGSSRYAHDHNNLTVQAAIGTQVDLKTMPDVGLLAEVGFDLNKANNYITFGAAWSFGSESTQGSSHD
jgi:hypothetical protein